ncbi:amidase [Serratia sp. M24T3]|uniref:amidase n=1 Tax=Serratia sp. M24T3 TaxID=932213 RepID=UPI00025B919D|nr:amidase [Serratia sp. M24T3]EIC83488.1 amidase [Serratia sp. M24T3]
MTSPFPLSLQQAIEQLALGNLTSAQLTETALKNIRDTEGEGSLAFTQVYEQWAREQAAASSARRAANKALSPIDGVPISIKDLFDVQGEATTGGSRVLADAPAAAAHAEIVTRLLAAGAVIIGKTNMTEFAYSGLGINPHYGTPANPWDRESRRIPGGSSSGAAVSVSDAMSFGAVGSDTGGSVRIPAAFCGLTGFKPTARRISMAGVLPLSASLDSVGTIAHDVASCVALDAAISGQPLSLTVKDLAAAHFAIPQTLVLDGLDEQVSSAFAAAIAALKQAGAKISEIPLGEISELASINATGGFTALESWAWHKPLIAARADGYDPRVVSRIRRGEPLGEKDRVQLVQQRADWQQRISSKVQQYDALLMPTVPFIAPTIAELEADEETYFRVNGAALRNPSVINFLDGCAVSLPCQKSGAAPVGLMVAALPMQDEALMSWAQEIERCLKSQDLNL